MHTYVRNNRASSARSKASALEIFDVRLVNLLLLFAILVSLVSYLALNNGVSTKGFQIRSLERKISDLEDDRQKLDLAAVEGQSMGTIDGRIQSLGFVPVSKLDFVNTPGGAVAIR